MARKRNKTPADETVQETQESPALDVESPEEIHFTREDVEEVGDPAAASTLDPEPEPERGPRWTSVAGGAAQAEPVADADTPYAAEPEPSDQEWEAPADAAWHAGGESADADRLPAGEAGGAGSAIGPVVGAFVGAFVAAKILGRFGGGDD